ncbi:YbaN family protein [Agarivorans sp. TSD2052]|uniref:YbaN family protein n=1 Tax=Agarivorans sp. TSD2052 TaxID=2937286 RepID=UPI00200BC9EC|nr:YbaN family protein [Agarivorans sp. TSD2052]UPW19249.1 YbaN family protein [Agarivorans sp. TSD2052]
MMLKLFFMLVAWISVLLGTLGIFLPLLPTTPFILLAVVLFSKSSPRFELWLLQHKVFGPLINNWQRYGVVSLKAKCSATLMVVISAGLMMWMNVPLFARIIAGSCLFLVMCFLWSRPSNKENIR